MRDITVLITAAGNVFMPGTIACLKNNGERRIRVIGADMSNDATILQMCDAMYQVPKGNDPTYVNALIEICKKENVDIVLPIMSVELNALSLNKELFESIGTKVSVSCIEGLRIANNKRHLLDYISKNGFVCADYRIASNMGELKEAVYSLGYPKEKVCVKTTDGSGSRGFRILDHKASKFQHFLNEKPSSATITIDELESILSGINTFPELLVMEYLPGQEYSVDLLASNGDILYSCCRKSLRMENSIMLDAEIVNAPSVVSTCEKITKALKLDGNIGFDIKERSDGTPIILECNPRITAGIPFFNLAGINLPYLCIKKMLGENLPELQINYGTVVKRRWMEMKE